MGGFFVHIFFTGPAVTFVFLIPVDRILGKGNITHEGRSDDSPEEMEGEGGEWGGGSDQSFVEAGGLSMTVAVKNTIHLRILLGMYVPCINRMPTEEDSGLCYWVNVVRVYIFIPPVGLGYFAALSRERRPEFSARDYSSVKLTNDTYTQT